ncbi:MAG: serine/threonine protein kinase [Holophagaceae bacterium]|nr:serine/threonine protein kinase [Holophagaceae bacterium]
MSGLRPPAQIGSVRLLEPLGEGGMALVFRGEDRFRPAASCAVKLLRPEVHRDQDLVRRFLREGEVLTRLSHPGLVEIFAFGTSGAWPYLIMELLPGGSLKACRGEAPAALVRRLIPVCGALGVAHAAGVVHRDLKPSNLLFATDGQLKVTDFGVCYWEGEEGRTRATRSQMVVGTLGYMAPEQHGDPRRVDGRCDVYALGAVLFEFMTGQPYAQVQLPPAAVRPGFPPRMAGLIMRALQPDPGQAPSRHGLLWTGTVPLAGERRGGGLGRGTPAGLLGPGPGAGHCGGTAAGRGARGPLGALPGCPGHGSRGRPAGRRRWPGGGRPPCS